MPIPERWRERFAEQALYGPEAWFVHDLREVDPECGRVVGVTDTTRLGPLVDAQRVLPGHEKHVPGAVAIQITGTLGQLHALFALGLLATEGWVGFGTHVRSARFPRIGRIGPELVVALEATRVRRIRKTVFVDYAFAFDQEGERIYESEQVAAWMQPTPR